MLRTLILIVEIKVKFVWFSELWSNAMERIQTLIVRNTKLIVEIQVYWNPER